MHVHDAVPPREPTLVSEPTSARAHARGRPGTDSRAAHSPSPPRARVGARSGRGRAIQVRRGAKARCELEVGLGPGENLPNLPWRRFICSYLMQDSGRFGAFGQDMQIGVVAGTGLGSEPWAGGLGIWVYRTFEWTFLCQRVVGMSSSDIPSGCWF